jgi:hypothetical protein
LIHFKGSFVSEIFKTDFYLCLQSIVPPLPVLTAYRNKANIYCPVFPCLCRIFNNLTPFIFCGFVFKDDTCIHMKCTATSVFIFQIEETSQGPQSFFKYHFLRLRRMKHLFWRKLPYNLAVLGIQTFSLITIGTFTTISDQIHSNFPLLSWMLIVNGNAHSKYNIPHSKKRFSLVSYIGWFLLSLFPISRHLHFSFWIRIAENTPTSCFTIHIMKVLRQSPLCIHDVVGKFAFCYPYHC